MEQMIDFGPIKHLRQAGIRPGAATWEAILALGPAAIPPLLELALDLELLLGKASAAYAPLHALRLLGQLPAGAEAERLLRPTIPEGDPATDAAFLWDKDRSQIVGSWGAAALPGIQAVIDDHAAPVAQRSQAVEALSFAAEADPAARSAVITVLRSLLLGESDPGVIGFVVQALADLNVTAAYADVMAAFRRGAVDKTVISASDARQQLLGDQDPSKLHCVHHTLAERYEQHGPFTEEQQRRLAELYRQQAGRLS
ncbi:MAG: DUF1186 domain-containing protein [Herpetosiphonaceae bacterium]|nr:DUF1186 domain-containing protein [Herpetosiphonaceae bacterium]